MLKGLLGRSGFVSSSAVFPDIDTRVIAKRLGLDKKGRERGARNLPAPSATDLDSFEGGAVEEVSRLRRAGLQAFEDHRRVYRERFDRATETRRTIELTVSETTGDFQSEIKRAEQSLRQSAEEVGEAYRWLQMFRNEHRLERPAYVESNPWLMLLALGVGLCGFEALLNSTTFAGAHEMGLLGGALMALLIAVINVTTASLLGGFIRMKNHVRLIPKSIGLLLLIGLIVFALGFNLGVAHFRDAMVLSPGMEAAAISALDTLIETPLGIESLQSWLLFGLGALVSFVSAIKAYSAFDPYPGYARVGRMVRDAREDYREAHADALQSLQDRRDDALEKLEESRKDTETRMCDAIDAKEGLNSLSGHLETFLSQSDAAVQRLLSIYRDANRETRTKPEPESFSQMFRFERVEARDIAGLTLDTEEDRRSADALIDAAIKDMIAKYDAAIGSFRSIESHEVGEDIDDEGKVADDRNTHASTTRLTLALIQEAGA